MEKVIATVEPTGSGFSAYIQDLPGVVSVGSNWIELQKNMKQALSFHIDGFTEYGESIPEKFTKTYSLEFELDLSTLFELFSPLKKSTIAEMAGMNPSLLRQYTKGIKHPSFDQAKRIEQAIHQLGRELLNVRLVR